MRTAICLVFVLALVVPCAAQVPTEVTNATYPVWISWKEGDKEKGFTQKGILPEGEVTITPKAKHGGGWFQIADVIVNDTIVSRGLAPTKLTLKKGDKVTIYAYPPVAPHNAMIVSIKDTPVMLSLMSPWTAFRTGKGQFKGDEKEPNTAVAWAKYGSKGLAEELAAYFVAHRGDKEKWGNFRGKRHTSMVVPAPTEDTVADALRTISKEELAKELEIAFEKLKKQKPPLGPSIDEEVKAAKKALPQD